MNLSKEDIKWQKFNQKLLEQMKENDFWGLSVTYYKMAAFLKEKGSKYDHLKQKGFEMKHEAFLKDLTGYLNMEYITGFKTFSNENCCDECKKRSEKLFSIEEARKNPPLPVKECISENGCSCGFITTRD